MLIFISIRGKFGLTVSRQLCMNSILPMTETVNVKLLLHNVFGESIVTRTVRYNELI